MARKTLVQATPTAKADATLASGLRRAVAWGLRTRALEPVRLNRGDWLYIVALYVLTRALILFLGLLGTVMFPEVGPSREWILRPITELTPEIWLRIYVHFDSGWYLGISHHYPLPSDDDPDWLRQWAFFPLYPLLLHPVALALRLLHVPGNPDAIAGVLVSHAALFGALVYLYRLVRAELTTAAAQRAITYLLIFPTSLFLSAVYPEGLFLLLSAGAFYHARRRQWAFAGLLAAGAALTRVQGLALLLPLALEFWGARRERPDPVRLRALWLGLPMIALAGYALYSRAQTGYWLAFAEAGRVWGRRLTPPFYPALRYELAPTLGGAFQFDFASANFAAVVVFVALGVVALLRLPPAYALWLWLGLLIPLASGGKQMTSLARYVLPIFPAFVAMAAWSLRLRWSPEGTVADADAPRAGDLRDRVIVIPSLLLMALYILMFVNGVFAAV